MLTKELDQIAGIQSREKSRSRHLGAGFLIVFAFLLAGCTAHEKPSTIERALANAAKDLVIPMEAEKLKNPLSSDQ